MNTENDDETQAEEISEATEGEADCPTSRKVRRFVTRGSQLVEITTDPRVETR